MVLQRKAQDVSDATCEGGSFLPDETGDLEGYGSRCPQKKEHSSLPSSMQMLKEGTIFSAYLPTLPTLDTLGRDLAHDSKKGRCGDDWS